MYSGLLVSPVPCSPPWKVSATVMNSPDTLSTRSSCVPIRTTSGSLWPNTASSCCGMKKNASPSTAAHGEPESRRGVHPGDGAVRLPRAEVLSRDRADAPIRPNDVHVMSEKSCE